MTPRFSAVGALARKRGPVPISTRCQVNYGKPVEHRPELVAVGLGSTRHLPIVLPAARPQMSRLRAEQPGGTRWRGYRTSRGGRGSSTSSISAAADVGRYAGLRLRARRQGGEAGLTGADVRLPARARP